MGGALFKWSGFGAGDLRLLCDTASVDLRGDEADLRRCFEAEVEAADCGGAGDRDLRLRAEVAAADLHGELVGLWVSRDCEGVSLVRWCLDLLRRRGCWLLLAAGGRDVKPRKSWGFQSHTAVIAMSAGHTHQRDSRAVRR